MKPGKYTTNTRYWAAKLRRFAVRLAISPLVEWKPLLHPNDGYTMIVGVNPGLLGMLDANLRLLARQDLSLMRQLIIVVGTSRSRVEASRIETRLKAEFPTLPLTFLYYTPVQYRIAASIRWAWVYSWLSWCIGIAEAKTRYVILHDFDALLIRRDLLINRYRSMLDHQVQYVGVRAYEGNGVLAQDELVTTFELMFDAQFVRKQFEPLDLFNHVTMYQGRTVDFDTFLYAQSMSGAGTIVPIEQTEMVHPSQMICQFVELTERGRLLTSKYHNLMLIPYYLFLSGDGKSMQEITDDLRTGGQGTLRFLGTHIPRRTLADQHIRWMRVQAERVERTLHDHVRPEVEAYFYAIEKHMISQES